MKRDQHPGQTVLEYARANGLTVDWVYRLARAGKIAHVRMLGRVFITEPKTQKESQPR